MTLNQFIATALEQEQALLLMAVGDLTPAELAWQPGPGANSIGWMLWHTLRVEDMWIHFFCQGQYELWERDGWHERFGLPTRDNGFGHSPERVANFPALELEELLRYGAAVRAATLDYLHSLSPEDFAAEKPLPWARDTSISIARVFMQLIGEFYQHQGQIAYLKGLQRGAGSLPASYGATG